MNYGSLFISTAAVLLLVLYIIYNEGKNPYPVSDYSVTVANVEHLMPEVTPDQKPNARSLELPKSMSFAGEEVPLSVSHVRERLDRELHINTYWHNNTIFLMKRGNRWLPQMEKILKKNGIPDDFKYLTTIESGLVNAVSPAKAVGFWQLLKSSAKENGLEINKEVDERYNPIKATEAACSYLKRAHRKFGNWTNVAASYNRGMAGLQKAMNNQQEDSYYDLLLNSETSRYVFRILAIKEIFENPEKYGFAIDREHLYKEEPLRYLTIEKTIPDLISFAKAQGISYRLLKRHNPWLRANKLTVRKGRTYRIALPVDTGEGK